MKNACLSLCLSVLSFTAQAQQSIDYSVYTNLITATELEEHIHFLASEELAGRGTGQPGLELAASYIRSQFSASGLHSLSSGQNAFFQPFHLLRGGVPDLRLITGIDTLNSTDHLIISGYPGYRDSTLSYVFTGWGIDHPNYSDFLNDTNIWGKACIFFAGEPRTKNGRYLLTDAYLPAYTDGGRSKAIQAYQKGAAMVIRIEPDQERMKKTMQLTRRYSQTSILSLPSTQDDQKNGLPLVIQTSIEDASRLMQIPVNELERSLNRLRKGRNQTNRFSGELTLEYRPETHELPLKNVLGFIRGSDWPDEWIILVAHYDHLGQKGESIFYGADDNATGTAALIEIAESFARMEQDGIRPKRSVMFLAVSAEEVGLLGSRYYVDHPAVPLEQTHMVVNLDMIGRTDRNNRDQPDYVYVYVSDSTDGSVSSATREAITASETTLTPLFRYKEADSLGMGGSDHVPFERKGVPVLYFYCGLHEDYHRQSDTPEKIDYRKATQIARMVCFTTLFMANQQFDN